MAGEGGQRGGASPSGPRPAPTATTNPVCQRENLPGRHARSGAVRELLLLPGLCRQHAGNLQAYRGHSLAACGKRYGRRSKRRKYQRTRASISLPVRRHARGAAAAAGRSIACVAKIAGASTSIRRDCCAREHFRQFAQVLEAFRKRDQQAVIYSDVLEYIDRENELAEVWTWNASCSRKLQARPGSRWTAS